MTAPEHEPLIAEAGDGLVHIVCEPTMARALAQALEFTFASGEFEAHHRPQYFWDCQALVMAAFEADRENAAAPVSLVAAEPRLRLVSGGAA